MPDPTSTGVITGVREMPVIGPDGVAYFAGGISVYAYQLDRLPPEEPYCLGVYCGSSRLDGAARRCPNRKAVDGSPTSVGQSLQEMHECRGQPREQYRFLRSSFPAGTPHPLGPGPHPAKLRFIVCHEEADHDVGVSDDAHGSPDHAP